MWRIIDSPELFDKNNSSTIYEGLNKYKLHDDLIIISSVIYIGSRALRLAALDQGIATLWIVCLLVADAKLRLCAWIVEHQFSRITKYVSWW